MTKKEFKQLIDKCEKYISMPLFWDKKQETYPSICEAFSEYLEFSYDASLMLDVIFRPDDDDYEYPWFLGLTNKDNVNLRLIILRFFEQMVLDDHLYEVL